MTVGGRRVDGGRLAQVPARAGRRGLTADRAIERWLGELGAALAASDGPLAQSAADRMEQITEYTDAPVNARLVAALAVADQGFRVSSPVVRPGMEAVLDHLWRWLTVTPATFSDWEEWSSPLLSRFTAAYPGSSPGEDDLGRFGRALVDLVYGQLFGAVIDPVSLADLHEVAYIGKRWGCALPPASSVVPVFRVEVPGHWGRVLSDVEVVDLRRELASR